MAKVVAYTGVDLDGINLNTLVREADEANFYNNVDLAYEGETYADVYQVTFGGYAWVAIFAGDRIDYDADDREITGGTVNAFAEASLDGMAGYTVEGIEVSAKRLYDAALTSSTSDDRAIVRSALSGRDTFELSPDADRAHGYDSNDRLLGRGGDDMLYGDAGRDRVEGEGGDDRLYGGRGGDKLYGGDGIDRLYGEGDDDHLNGGRGGDVLLGGSGEDNLYGFEDADKLSGGAGRDRLDGGKGADRLSGEAGRDRLDGGSGDDRLSGGSGDDTFVFNGGDVITYFGNNADTLELNDRLWDGRDLSKGEVLGFARVEDGDVVFDFGGDTLRIEGLASVGTLANDLAIV